MGGCRRTCQPLADALSFGPANGRTFGVRARPRVALGTGAVIKTRLRRGGRIALPTPKAFASLALPATADSVRNFLAAGVGDPPQADYSSETGQQSNLNGCSHGAMSPCRWGNNNPAGASIRLRRTGGYNRSLLTGNHGRGCGVGRSLRGGAGRGVGVGRIVAVGVAVGVGGGVTVGVGLGVGVGVGLGGGVSVAVGVTVGLGVGVGLAGGVGVGVVSPCSGAWILIDTGEPVLKNTMFAVLSAGGELESKRKFNNVPNRIALAFWLSAKVSQFQIAEF